MSFNWCDLFNLISFDLSGPYKSTKLKTISGKTAKELLKEEEDFNKTVEVPMVDPLQVTTVPAFIGLVHALRNCNYFN